MRRPQVQIEGLLKQLYGRDQFGNNWGPLDSDSPKRSLLEETGRIHASPMYKDTKDGAVQVGYVVSPRRGSHEYPLWVTLYWKDPWGKKR